MIVFGLYLTCVAGLGLMLIPNILLSLFGFTASDEGWIRMIGMLATIIGAYYVLAARAGMEDLYRWSIPLRLYAATFMVLMYLTGAIEAGILLFAFIDACGAVWTWASLRREKTLNSAQ